MVRSYWLSEKIDPEKIDRKNFIGPEYCYIYELMGSSLSAIDEFVGF